jgi:hypothetical protein
VIFITLGISSLWFKLLDLSLKSKSNKLSKGGNFPALYVLKNN